jgi:hypothetical protein
MGNVIKMIDIDSWIVRLVLMVVLNVFKKS